MLTATAMGAWDRLPAGCAVLVIVLLSLLLWAILWILLWRLFGTERVADFQQNIKRHALVPPHRRSTREVSRTSCLRGDLAGAFRE